jgi:hypothetical protein
VKFGESYTGLPATLARRCGATNLRGSGYKLLPVVFAKELREGVRRGRITCSVRIWARPHVKVGGRYRLDEGEIHVDSIEPIRLADITPDLARESGFPSVAALLKIARHGPGRNVYLIRFRYIPPGGWLPSAR